MRLSEGTLLRFIRAAGRGLAAGSLLLAAVALSSCSASKPKQAETEPPTPVEVGDVTRGPIDRIIESDAVLYPVDQASIAPKITSPVRRVLVRRGEHVKAGQVLIELENRDLAAAAEESHSQYEQAQANLQTTQGATVPADRVKAESDVQAAQQAFDAAKAVYENRVALQREGALAQKLVDDAKVALVQAQSQLETARSQLSTLQQVGASEQIHAAQAQANAAKAHYDSAQVQMSYAELRSPIDGVVADRPVYAGDMGTTGTPVVSIVNVSKIVARANIPIGQASAIKLGDPANINAPDGVVSGKVTVVSPATDANTTTVEVWIEADNAGEKLKPGATVHLAVNAGLIKDTLLVPSDALLNSDEGGQMVLVVDDKNVVHERKVNVGVREGPRAQILSGVTEGEKVVTSGGLGLDDKAKVEIKSDEDDDDDDDNAK